GAGGGGNKAGADGPGIGGHPLPQPETKARRVPGRPDRDLLTQTRLLHQPGTWATDQSANHAHPQQLLQRLTEHMLENNPDQHKRGVTTQYGPQTLGRELSDRERATESHTVDS